MYQACQPRRGRASPGAHEVTQRPKRAVSASLRQEFDEFAASQMLPDEVPIGTLPLVEENSLRWWKRRFPPGLFGIVVSDRRVLFVSWSMTFRAEGFWKDPAPARYELAVFAARPRDAVMLKRFFVGHRGMKAAMPSLTLRIDGAYDVSFGISEWHAGDRGRDQRFRHVVAALRR
jgi:hypothetical protein